METQCSCILCQFVQICTNVIIDIDGLAGGVIVDLVHIDGAQLGAIRLGNGHFDFLAGEGVGANGGCAAVIVVPRVQAGFHCIGLGSSIINRGFLAAVYLVPLVGNALKVTWGYCGSKDGSIGLGVAINSIIVIGYGYRYIGDGGLLNGYSVCSLNGIVTRSQQVIYTLSCWRGDGAVGAAGEFYFGAGGNFQLSNSTIPCYGKLALCYFQFIYGYSSQIKRYLRILSTVSHALLVPNWIYRY